MKHTFLCSHRFCVAILKDRERESDVLIELSCDSLSNLKYLQMETGSLNVSTIPSFSKHFLPFQQIAFFGRNFYYFRNEHTHTKNETTTSTKKYSQFGRRTCSTGIQIKSQFITEIYTTICDAKLPEAK